MALDGRATLLDLMAPVALDQRDLQPLLGAFRAGEWDRAGRPSSPIQCTAGSGPGTNLCSTGDAFGRGRDRGQPDQVDAEVGMGGASPLEPPTSESLTESIQADCGSMSTSRRPTMGMVVYVPTPAGDASRDSQNDSQPALRGRF